MAPQQQKADLRARLLTARRAVPDAVRAAEADALAGHVMTRVAAHDVVAAYVPLRGEPGAVAMLDGLRARRVTVLLPRVRDGSDGTALPLGWGRYRGADALVRRRFGLREPSDDEGADALAAATLVLVPALAVDRSGTRLGRGAGCYDRSLAACTPGTPTVAVVRDEELLATLPKQAHDVPVSHALTPGTGFVALG